MSLLLWILAALTTIAAGYFTYRADARRGIPYPWLTTGLRCILIALAWLLLLAPAITMEKQEVQKPVVVLLQDESQSIPATLKGDTSRYRKEFETLQQKLSQQYKVVTWGFGNSIQADSLFRYRQQGTNIGAALQRATDFYGSQNLGAVVLATDGRFNEGSHPLYQNLSLRSPLYTIALGDTATPKDIRITQLYANRTVSKGSQFEIRADLVATNCAGYNGNVSLSEAGGGTLQTQSLSIAGLRFDRSVSFSITAATPGLHHYIIAAAPADGEANTANNRRDVFIQIVEEQKQILIAAAAPHPDVNALREALQGLETYKVTIRTSGDLPASLSEYGIIILHGMPAAASITRQLQAARKPVWYIVGKSTNPAMLAQLQLPATISGNPAAGRDVFAATSGSFSAFTLPQTINSVMDKMPPLQSASGNAQAAANATVLLYQRGASATTAPLWILQQGNPSAALLYGEGIWRWRLYEYRYFHNHAVIDELIRQTVSLLAANASDKPFRTEIAKYIWSDQEPVALNAYLLNANNEPVNTPPASLELADSAGHKQAYSFERNGNAYRINIGIHAGGTYHYAASTVYNGKTYTDGGSFVVNNTPVELMETGADYPLLYSLSKKYGGGTVLYPATASLYDSITRNQNIRPLIQTHTETAPIVDWKWFFFLLLAVAVTEWLLRKYWLAQ